MHSPTCRDLQGLCLDRLRVHPPFNTMPLHLLTDLLANSSNTGIPKNDSFHEFCTNWPSPTCQRHAAAAVKLEGQRRQQILLVQQSQQRQHVLHCCAGAYHGFAALQTQKRFLTSQWHSCL